MCKYPNLCAADFIDMDSIGKRSRSCIDGIEIAVERNEPENIEHYFTLFCETFRGKHALREFHCRVSRYMPTEYMELMVRIFEIQENRYISLKILDGNCPLEDVPIFISAIGFHIKMKKRHLYNRYIDAGERWFGVFNFKQKILVCHHLRLDRPKREPVRTEKLNLPDEKHLVQEKNLIVLPKRSVFPRRINRKVEGLVIEAILQYESWIKTGERSIPRSMPLHVPLGLVTSFQHEKWKDENEFLVTFLDEAWWQVEHMGVTTPKCASHLRTMFFTPSILARILGDSYVDKLSDQLLLPV